MAPFNQHEETMKKSLAPLLLCTALSAFSASETVSEAQLVGRWQCTTEYPEIKTTIVDTITLHPDYRVEDTGEDTMRIAGETFRYQIISHGTWKLEGKQLSFALRDDSITPRHDVQTQKHMENSTALRKFERDIAASFSLEEENIIVLRIDSIDKNNMQQTQLNDRNGEEMAKSRCKRL